MAVRSLPCFEWAALAFGRQRRDESLACYDSPRASATPAVPPLMQRRKGDVGGDYAFGRILGQGGFGVVSHATGRRTGQAVAIKRMLLSSFAHEPARLASEVSIAATIRHPHVAQLFEFYIDNVEVYMVMELCTGGELFDLVKPAGVEEGLMRTYAWQMLSAVGYLHACSIVHRDIQTENFMLQSVAPGAPVKLIDFGLSRRYRSGEAMTTVVGTIYYLAPEMLHRCYSELADVWAVGVTVYLLLSGRYPFMGSSDSSTVRRIHKGRAAFPRKTWSGISSWAVDFVRKLLEYADQGRPSAHEAMRDAWLKPPPGLDADFQRELAARHRKFAAAPWPLQVAMAAAAGCVPEAPSGPVANMFARRWADESFCDARSFDDATVFCGDNLASRTGGSYGGELRRALKAADVDYATWLAASAEPGFFSQPAVVETALRALCLDDEGRVSRAALVRAAGALAPSLARTAGAQEAGPDVEADALAAALAGTGASGDASANTAFAELAGMVGAVCALTIETPRAPKRPPSMDSCTCSTAIPSQSGDTPTELFASEECSDEAEGACFVV